MALRLLPPNASFTWSCKPISTACHRILRQLAELSPRRQFYPPHLQSMQNVRWPAAISESCAHEAFYLIAAKLISDSERMAFAFASSSGDTSSSNSTLPLSPTSWHLSRRAYLRQAKLLTETERADTLFATATPATQQQKPALIYYEYTAPAPACMIRCLTSSTWHWSGAIIKVNLVSLIFQLHAPLRWKQAESARLVHASVTSWFERLDSSYIRQNWLELYKCALGAHRNANHMSKLKVFLCH